MRKETKHHVIGAICMLVGFVLWTVAVCTLDRQPIGPQESVVGLATINRRFHSLTGVHMALYTITDWLSLIPLGMIPGFAILGLIQWIQRRQLKKVDPDILWLGGFYILVFGCFLAFEQFPVNARPLLIEGVLEASYPSSTTMLVLCVMPTTVMALNRRIGSKCLRRLLFYFSAAFSLAMVALRLISGVHWLTDIIGGILLSMGLVLLYRATISR